VLSFLSTLQLALMLPLGAGASLAAASKEAMTPVAMVAGPDCDPSQLELRRTALFALMENFPDRIPSLVEPLKKRTDACAATLRLDFLNRLGRAGRRDGNRQSFDPVPIFRDFASSDPDTLIRKTAIERLRGDTAPETVAALGQAARNAPTTAIRDYAVAVLTAQPSVNASKELRALYPSIKDPNMRRRVIDVVARNDSTAWTWLFDIVGSNSEVYEIRTEALSRALYPRSRYNRPGQANQQQDMNSTAIPTSATLGKLYRGLGDNALQLQIITALGQRNDDHAVDELARIAKSDPDYSLRKRAVAGLQGSSNKRAPQLLAEIVAQK
jgi:hypothetical protein